MSMFTRKQLLTLYLPLKGPGLILAQGFLPQSKGSRRQQHTSLLFSPDPTISLLLNLIPLRGTVSLTLDMTQRHHYCPSLTTAHPLVSSPYAGSQQPPQVTESN